jgi:hypothetical protein
MRPEAGRFVTASAAARKKTAQQGYGWEHQQLRAQYAPLVLAGRVACARCGELILPWQAFDLGHDDHDRSRYTGPEHRNSADCREGGNRATAGRRQPLLQLEPLELELDGLLASDPRWRVPWLEGLLEPPEDATWPRLMTVPHPAAAGSLGAEFVAWVERREGQRMRWWQKLVATRVLEVDADGRLVWLALLLSMSRQLGKSWLLRELILWRVHQGDRFGEPQDVMHTGKDMQIVREVQRPARAWAMGRGAEFRVRLANGDEQIELLADGSRWLLRAQEAVYGHTASLGVVDEAWKVRARVVNDGLMPTIVAREQPQLYLVSTAHRFATGLMLSRRQIAYAQLEAGDGDLLIEWSAAEDAAVDDVAAWRQASPHWTPQRERLIRERLEAARSGELEDPDELDPEQGFQAQWLNRWPRSVLGPGGPIEELMPPGQWQHLAEPGVTSSGPVFIAIEDAHGTGAAVAAAARLSDGRLEVDGHLFDDWDSALAWTWRLGAHRQIRRILVGASMLNRVPAGMRPAPVPAGSRETRLGLPMLRELASGGVLVHDDTTADLDAALALARVRETASGLQPVRTGSLHLVKALVWAVGAAQQPAPMPAIF